MVKIALDLLKAEHIGVRELKAHLSRKLLEDVLIITERGVPISINLPYSDMLDLVDILDELSDPETIQAIQNGRADVKKGRKGRNVSGLFKRIRANRK